MKSDTVDRFIWLVLFVGMGVVVLVDDVVDSNVYVNKSNRSLVYFNTKSTNRLDVNEEIHNVDKSQDEEGKGNQR